jgi:hypothetical protein
MSSIFRKLPAIFSCTFFLGKKSTKKAKAVARRMPPQDGLFFSFHDGGTMLATAAPNWPAPQNKN